VRDEEGEECGAQRVALAVETHLAVESVVGDVADQEEAGYDEGAKHAGAVRVYPSALDLAEAHQEQDGAEQVQGRVQGRKEGQVRSGDVGGLVVIDKPAEEERCGHTDGDDGGDDRWRSASAGG
jgi:hypothetical protein